MTSPWMISAAAERVQLNPQRQGQVTFTVTNSGPVDARAVLEVMPGENANPAWFLVDEPQRPVPHGGSTTFLVRIAAPMDARPGWYWLAGRVYSADAAPEESSAVSNRVGFDVVGAPAKAKSKLLLWLIPVAATLLVVAGVVGWLVLRDTDAPQAQPQPPAGAPSGPMPDLTGSVEQEALAALTKRGVKVVTVYRHDPPRAGRVIDQSIAPGTELTEGDTADLEVAVSLAQPRHVSPPWVWGSEEQFPQGGESPELVWEPVHGAASYRVEVQAMECRRTPQGPGERPNISCDYGVFLIDEGTVDGTSFRPKPMYFPPDDGTVLVWADGGVRWRVIAIDDFGGEGPPSEYSYFEMTP
jgi:hypothetical protein